MKSKSFSRSKRLRYKTKSFKNSVKYIKTFRIRNDRRLNKMILKFTHNQDLLVNKISLNNGNLYII